MTDKLKPCPFCLDPMAWSAAYYVHHRIQTPGCPISPYLFRDLAAWNRRADHIVDAAEMVTEPAGDLVDAIAATIRRVDGKHNMGAGILAGHIAETVTALFQPQMEAADEHRRTMEALKDPIAVLVNMQRGAIAVPSLRACLDLHGKLGAWDAAGGLLRAAAPFGELVDAWHHNLRFQPKPDDQVFFEHGDRVAWVTPAECLNLEKAINAAKAAGIGGSHD